MTDPAADPWGWVVPALVVFGAAALAIAVGVALLRRARRSPRARAAARALQDEAGAALVRLDDAVTELDLEVALSGALYGGTGGAPIRRARLTAQHARDESFEEYRLLGGRGDAASPDDIRRASSRIRRRCESASAAVVAARTRHREWMAQNVSAADQVRAAQGRLAELRAGMGDPATLVAELSARFDEDEWQDAARSARAATTGVAEAGRLLDEAETAREDPSRSILPLLASAERALRRAQEDARVLEESHRLSLQASQATRGELEAARAALAQAVATLPRLDPDAATRLGRSLAEAEAELATLERDASRRPTRAIEGIARLRTRLDLGLGEARTAQQRVRGARTALPGTLATARRAVVRAEAAVARARTGHAARVHLASAQRELADARQAADPVTSLAAARCSIRHADDAKALADHAATETDPGADVPDTDA